MSMLFNSLSSEHRAQRQLAHDACHQYNRAPSKGHFKKLRAIFAAVGDNLIIEQGFYCDYGDKISFGDNVFLNINCTFLDGARITIGNDCLIGPNVQILTVNHPLSAEQRLQKLSFVKDVSIGNNVWIGAGAIVLPGVSIGDNAVVAAGSVVSKPVDQQVLVAGNPAQFIRDLN
jgi:maltose O-acetyltransferase